MKEMVYKTEPTDVEVLDTGYFFGYLYYILSLGTHPTAYVKIPEGHKLSQYDNYDDMPINCHCGLTYHKDHLRVENKQIIEGNFIGWDYAHIGDYFPYLGDLKDKKWTTEEIRREVKEVCRQMREM